MSLEICEAKKDSEAWDFSEACVARWRLEAEAQRDALFRKKRWKNRQQALPIQSRAQEQSFGFVLGWYEESGEELRRGRERERLDGLIARGMDVNAPKQKKHGIGAGKEGDAAGDGS